ncbi:MULTISPECIES: ABC transporter ATP-binding protein [unclassified Bosea (in: a-proteobacteria)]|uniref:ABC transporter ATP-binding protein n=1 Tax=unclassified Bosea (in: a-proteobacteria) TaxID=2653178 RepID=UPI000F76546E|nr:MULTISPECIES: ABC transporter ATP-binding protein [unclassified Bosea (in: a-proteobacteria)]AZO78030.1 sugar ABC transporter ATP-binding protein [Bosea sp. Tri-49]RXT19209.1 sugar ABC transporter ATP-binding protein [Bosea sp. Tri-39]RXT41481.1 sugar ABC transporter ATP-binding protein [Bosea sp. Tri-54]
MAEITIDGIAKSFGTARALEQIDLTVADGEFVALLGPSGCGKTTLLRIIAGLESATSGRIVIGERDLTEVPTRRRGLAMVFQNYAVFPHMNVYENVAFGLRMQGADEARIKARVGKATELLHITPYLDRYPAKLSGGQRQRVAVARALAVEPPVLLMDEPLSNLDALLRLEMRAELKAVLREARTTTIYVTHDQTEAMGLADRIAVMHGGRIEQIDRPTAVYERPATIFVGGFVGSPPMNFLPVTIVNSRLELPGSSLPAPQASGALLMGIRAEDLTPVADGEGLPFDIAVVEPLGAHDLVTGRSGQTLLRVAAPAGSGHKPGTRIGLRPDPKRLVWMDPASGRAIQAQ